MSKFILGVGLNPQPDTWQISSIIERQPKMFLITVQHGTRVQNISVSFESALEIGFINPDALNKITNGVL